MSLQMSEQAHEAALNAIQQELGTELNGKELEPDDYGIAGATVATPKDTIIAQGKQLADALSFMAARYAAIADDYRKLAACAVERAQATADILEKEQARLDKVSAYLDEEDGKAPA